MNVVALILAGGQGTRLGAITEYLAKPAVPYGGKYRIIDFALSNCVNSGIHNVGVLTQYRPHILNKHLGIGRPWDLDIKTGGLTILPPYVSNTDQSWYRGTADAIYQNIEYIDSHNPDFVVILSGDHIYKMDYNEMIDYHIEKGADITIACMEVPISEAHRFGIMVTNSFGKIVEFQEKPAEPKGNLASLGIYVFSWEILRKLLIEDAEDVNSDHDFGKNIIPKMLENKNELYAFNYEGYWRDVGTLQSYWESNLELLGPMPLLNLHEINWKIYTQSEELPPAYISEKAHLIGSLVSEGSEVYGSVENSVIFQGVIIEEGAVVKDSVIMNSCVIKKGAYIEKAIICERAEIGENSKIGIGEYAENSYNSKVYNSEITLIGFDVKIPSGIEIGKNVLIGNGVKEIENNIPSGGYIL
ncbi:glucose-1-phosphate adenylyltransferase [Marinitoga sp. 1135]|uniref:Glucose-1-phosphate adenylyltransferase n=1 Tax=Marinitoga piezophila (strain DSM 14283 / JCM 11233 / KA3) TaxID=443254 RepID=H2J592_MARPK|nr:MULTISPECIES: glucose-1-phosphate adenylyltransferase [Marinitoga]AEX84950.1 glucose-1-phosphate adenylyltransferase [Marinitoga piezophila KA3]APT75457.1 glucose-1-phosphate adenylyltransferase [Marinitoga sp. 1137]NUU95182.1 glucose-1-phosphate adenylyltransferase [Marinitoga sp. 1135]NUU97114.1 glucose-1-phosphate adenylyltransferase [Marinitoga sp. 1138]